MEVRKEGFGGEKIKRYERFLPLAHGDGGPLGPGTAEEECMVLLEEVVVVPTRKETGGRSPRQGWRNGECRRIGSQKLDAASLGVTPAMKWMAASTLTAKSRKAGRFATSSEMRAR